MKRTKLTREQLLKLKPCSDGIRWYDAQGTTDLAALAQAAYDQKKYADIIWLAVRLMSRKERIMFACYCARSVANLNTDPRVMAAIEAAERCIEHDTASNRDAAADAADAARAADVARAAYAAYAVKAMRTLGIEVSDGQ